MGLIKCVECGNKISDSAESCPKCGFPMHEYVSYVNDEKRKIEEKKLQLENKKKAEEERIEREKRMKNIKCVECGKKIGNVDICPFCGFDMKKYNREKEENEKRNKELERQRALTISQQALKSPNMIKCPKCGSTQIQMVTRKYSFLTGFATNKVDRVCMNCKYRW